MQILENQQLQFLLHGMRSGVNAKKIIFYDTIEDVQKIKTKWPESIFLGHGYNTIFSNSTFDKPICLSKQIKELKLELEDDVLRVPAHMLNKDILKFSLENNLSGLECLHLIPGTVGGSVAGNAGQEHNTVCQKVLSLLVCDESGSVFQTNNFDYSYRSCSLSKYVILSVDFILKSDSKKSIKEKMKNISDKKKRQDFKNFSCGCIFKNPSNLHAGKIIDECGLLGKRIGNYSVSKTHGNFILNDSIGSNPIELIELINFVQKTVFLKTGISLEREVRLL